MEMPGIEPGAFHMQSERSTAELHPLPWIPFLSWSFLIYFSYYSQNYPAVHLKKMVKTMGLVPYCMKVLLWTTQIFLDFFLHNYIGPIDCNKMLNDSYMADHLLT